MLRFQTFVYNAAKGSTAPDVEIQARVLKNGKTVMSSAPARLPTDTTNDLVRLPYWAEIALDQLPPGRYALQVTATDRLTKIAFFLFPSWITGILPFPSTENLPGAKNDQAHLTAQEQGAG